MKTPLLVDAVFGRRDFAAGRRALPGWQADRITWSLPGGPDVASISRVVPSGTLSRWRDLLRCPVELFTPDGQRAWWGYVSSVILEDGAGGWHLALDEMRNTVICRFQEFSGVTRTLRVRDEASAALYGEKETMLDLGESSTVRAEAAARAVLQRLGAASGVWRPGAETAAGEQRVQLELRGWWHTLGWRLFLSQGEGCAASEAPWSVNAEINIGAASTQARVAQAVVEVPPTGASSFLPWKVLEIDVRVQQVGSPTDSLQVSVYAVDASGIPVGSALDTALVPTGAEMQTVRVSLNGTAQISPGSPFGLVFARTGALNSSSFYRVGLHEQPGLAYPCRVWNGSVWVSRAPLANALVRALGGVQTTDLLPYYAAPERGGQFLTRVLVESGSGLDSAVQEARVRTCQQEVEDLLSAGCADGSPMLALVDAARVLRVFPAPPPVPVQLLIGPGGSLLHPGGRPVQHAGQALGRWARSQAWPDLPPVLVRGCAWVGGRLVLTSAPGRGWPR